MSSLASAPSSAAGEPAQATDWIRLGGLRLSTDSALGLCLAFGLALVAFVTTGGVDLGANTWTEIALVALGCVVAIAVLLIGAPGRRWGGATVALFGLLVVLSALSVTWSVAPDVSWTESGRTLSYLAVFGSGAALARIFPGRWAAIVGAVAAASTVIAGYALLAKVFPASLDPGETFGRLRAPFDYWNATGLIAALGLPASLWAGARRERARAMRALAVPAVALLITVIVLSYSRGAVLVAIVGLAVWFVLVPLRLRGALVLVLGGIGGAVFSIYAVRTHALTGNLVPIAARTTAGHAFGVLLVVGITVLLFCGLAAAFAMDRTELHPETRRRVATVLLVGVALLPVAGIGGLASSSRGLTGEISHVWNELTSATAPVGTGPTRLLQLGNSRGRYWREGLKVGEHNLLKGAGALAYGTAVKRYTNDPKVVGHAHSYVIETFADFGLIGIALMVAMLTSWAGATRRTLWGAPADRRAEEYAALLTMLSVVVVFGVHSTIDWTWFIPGTALPALLCAGWLAGRGPLDAAVGTKARARIREVPATAAAGMALLAIAVACVWAMLQPLRSSDAEAAALTAASRGNLTAAIGDARDAVDQFPVAVDPLYALSALYRAAGNVPLARSELVNATKRQPNNPDTWFHLGQFDLSTRAPEQAISSFQHAITLDQGLYQATLAIVRARAEIAAGQ